jgi:hypothetical protein
MGMHKTDLVDHIGKREEKRKHKKYLKLDNNKYTRIGQNWKKQLFHGRPHVNKMFMEDFNAYIIDSENNKIIIAEHSNWGSILAKTRQYIKDNAKEYYNTDKCVTVSGKIKKTGEWIDIGEFNTMHNRWFLSQKNELLEKSNVLPLGAKPPKPIHNSNPKTIEKQRLKKEQLEKEQLEKDQLEK